MVSAPRMSSIVGIGGYGGSGKDTAAAVLVQDHGYRLLSPGRHVAVMLAEIDPLVAMGRHRYTSALRAKDILADRGYDEAKRVPDFLRLLQHLGTAVNDLVPGFWMDRVLADVKPGEKAAVVGVRSPGDVLAIRRAEGVLLWIARDGVGPRNGHRNETEAGRIDFDRVVANNGTPAELWSAMEEALGLPPDLQ